jgi:hypothetical protein
MQVQLGLGHSPDAIFQIHVRQNCCRILKWRAIAAILTSPASPRKLGAAL